MNTTLQDKYIITYSNHFKIGNKTFAFRKKNLFEITRIPNYKPLQINNTCYGYWIERKWHSLPALQDMVIKEPKEVDVSNLQWFVQIELDECFNLNKYK